MSRRVALAALLAVSIGLLAAACLDDGGGPPSLGPSAERQLAQTFFRKIMATAFPAASFEPSGPNLTLTAAPDWTVEPLGRLTGQFAGDPSPEIAAFFALEGPERALAPGLDLSPGVYVVFAELERAGQLKVLQVAMLEETGERILPTGQAKAEGTSPFRQGQKESDTTFFVSPALVTDVEGDGGDELVLSLQRLRQAVFWERFSLYRLSADEKVWQRIGDPDGTRSEVPAQAVLGYWANLGAAAGIARRWDPETRLRVVWSWLSEEEAPALPEVVADLVPSGDPDETRRTAEALNLLRDFFQQAYSHFSPDFQTRQPWPGFLNGFRSTERVRLEGVGRPEFREDGEAMVDAILILVEREGEEPNSRRFLVTLEVIQIEGEWFLDGVEAEEQREPA